MESTTEVLTIYSMYTKIEYIWASGVLKQDRMQLPNWI